MRILVHEFASGGGLAGRPVPASLAREGAAMRTALIADLAAMGCHEIVATSDERFRGADPRGVEIVTLSPGSSATLDALIASTDAVWLIAPETDRCLERLAARVERRGTRLLGSGSAAIRRAADKADLQRRLAGCGVRHPQTRALVAGVDPAMAARAVRYPVVVKPGRGAGCQGVRRARNGRELRSALDGAHLANGTGPLVVQRYVAGTAASVSLIADGRRAVALAVNAQRVSASSAFSYRGGRTPFDHPLAAAAEEAAMRACAVFPGLRGYIGVDVVLTDTGPVVIEVNPRLTTSYLGVRAALDENVAALALAACDGILPAQPVARRRVRFTASGEVDVK